MALFVILVSMLDVIKCDIVKHAAVSNIAIASRLWKTPESTVFDAIGR